MNKIKGTIGILTGGGDVPGLNPAIRAVTFRAMREGYQVIGIRRGWAGLVDLVRDKDADNGNCIQVLNQDQVNRAGRTGGTFLHSSRTRPSHLPGTQLPSHLSDIYTDEINDVTPEVLKNLEEQEFDVIFVTAYDQFALKAFEFSAVDYLLKPIVKERLIAAVEKVSSLAETSISVEQLNMLMTNFQSYWQAQPRVALPTSEGLEFVSVDQIIYAQSESNYCWVFFDDGNKIFLSKTLKDLEGLLAKHGFIRIHQSYLINADFIKRYVRGQGGYIILSNGAKVPVSRSKKEVILNLGRW